MRKKVWKALVWRIWTQQCCVSLVLAEHGWNDMSPSWLTIDLCIVRETPYLVIGNGVMHECGIVIHSWNEILTNFPSCLVQHFFEWMGNHMWCTLWYRQILNKDGMAACIWYLHCCGNIIDILMMISVYSALHFTDYLCCMYFSQKITLCHSSTALHYSETDINTATQCFSQGCGYHILDLAYPTLLTQTGIISSPQPQHCWFSVECLMMSVLLQCS